MVILPTKTIDMIFGLVSLSNFLCLVFTDFFDNHDLFWQWSWRGIWRNRNIGYNLRLAVFTLLCMCVCMCFDRVLLLSCSFICLPIFYSSLYNCKSLFKDLMKAFSGFLCSFFFFFFVKMIILSVSFSDTLYHTAYRCPSYRFLGSLVINYFEDKWGYCFYYIHQV